MEKGERGQEVCMGYVEHVGEVKEVVVGAELEAGFVGAVDVDYGRDQLHVAFAEDSCGSEGDGEEFGRAVCGEDEGFCFCLKVIN